MQNKADCSIRNTDGKTALDLSDPSTRLVLTGEYRKEELLEAARTGNTGVLMALLTPLNVNCHAGDGRKVNFTSPAHACSESLFCHSQSTPLHLAAGYNRVGVVQLLLQHGADVHAKDKGGLVPLHNACSYGHFEVTELLLKVCKNHIHGGWIEGVIRILQLVPRVGGVHAWSQGGRTVYSLHSICRVVLM